LGRRGLLLDHPHYHPAVLLLRRRLGRQLGRQRLLLLLQQQLRVRRLWLRRRLQQQLRRRVRRRLLLNATLGAGPAPRSRAFAFSAGPEGRGALVFQKLP